MRLNWPTAWRRARHYGEAMADAAVGAKLAWHWEDLARGS